MEKPCLSVPRAGLSFLFIPFLFLIPGFMGCNPKPSVVVKPPARDIVQKKEAWEDRTVKNLKQYLDYALENNGKLNDSVSVVHIRLLSGYYKDNNYNLVWSSRGSSKYIGGKLVDFIKNSRAYGLFPQDYGADRLIRIQEQVLTDTNARNDAALWVRNDLFLTDAFISLTRDLKQGRLAYDSVTLRKDTILPDSFYLGVLHDAITKNEVEQTLHQLEPKFAAYDSIKSYLPAFLDSAKFVNYTFLCYPYTDSVRFFKQLQKRLLEDSCMPAIENRIDTIALTKGIRRYQRKKGMNITGKVSDVLVRSLNNFDVAKFKSIAINLDRYKLLPDSLPATYVWVNLPSFKLRLWDSGCVAFESRVIVGASKTRTPLLTSDIVNFITYPQWTVPFSIIVKEILPGIKKDTNYLAKQNLMVVDYNDSILDPKHIDWHKVNKNNFPYVIKQRQGDDNSLGVIKFNFRNKYSVYLHDTNARWLFGKRDRALSHGCVRVQEWQKMADFLIRNNQDKFPADTLKAWFKRQEKHVVTGFPKVPIYIRYFTCEGVNGKLNFFEDIYGEDQLLTERYFSNKIL
jgi:murein L,D-transpeptidase YcbB/YkuD